MKQIKGFSSISLLLLGAIIISGVLITHYSIAAYWSYTKNSSSEFSFEKTIHTLHKKFIWILKKNLHLQKKPLKIRQFLTRQHLQHLRKYCAIKYLDIKQHQHETHIKQ